MTDHFRSDAHVVVRSALAPLLGEPRISSALTSQLLAGDVLTVLESQGPWLRVRGADAYEGWTHSGFVSETFDRDSVWRWSLGCTVRDADGATRALPLGARVAPSVDVVGGDVIDDAARRQRFPASANAIAASAERLFAGASYLWGGVSPWGCDCSGFVQRVFALHGVALPRDAWQQAEVGATLSVDAAADHAPADLLFFSDRDDRRVTHVGIALNGDSVNGARMVHSSLMRGGVAIESMRAGDAYVARLRAQCVRVQRVL